MAVSLSAAAEVPKNIRLVDGRTLEGVKEAQLIEGKVKITHDSGVSRHPVSDLALASQKELGLLPKEKAGFIVPEVVEMPHGPPVPKLWTIKGKYFENVRAVKILNPSEISFTHDGGVVTLRIDQLEREIRPNYGCDKEKSKAYDAQSGQTHLNSLSPDNKLVFVITSRRFADGHTARTSSNYPRPASLHHSHSSESG